MKIAIRSAVEADRQSSTRLIPVVPSMELAGTNGSKSGKVFPSKLKSRKGAAKKKDSDKFTGRIQSFSIMEGSKGKHQVDFLLGSKKGKSRAFVLESCDTGVEKSILSLLVAALSANLKISLKTAVGEDNLPRVVEIAAHK